MLVVEKKDENIVVTDVVTEINLEDLPDISFLNRKEPSTIRLKGKIQRIGRKYQKTLHLKNFSGSVQCVEQLIGYLDHNLYNHYVVMQSRKILTSYVPMLISRLSDCEWEESCNKKLYNYLRIITCRDYPPAICIWNHHYLEQVQAYRKL